MKIAAIIAEYNPFHNGHAYQIQEVRHQLGVDGVVAILSPDYVQRGEPALMEKRIRTRAALENGVDLVVELPLPYATASAERFAYGGVKTAQAMGCVDYLCFGSECGSLSLLQTAANSVDNPSLKPILQDFLGEGYPFPKARQMAVEKLSGWDVASVLAEPNNILAIEYLRHLRETQIQPYTIQRQAVGHNSTQSVGQFASATYLRKQALHGEIQALQGFVPTTAYSLYEKAETEGFCPVSLARGERAILCQLRKLLPQLEAGTLSLPDLSEGIENRLAHAIQQATSLEELYFAIKTKRYPLSRVRRLVLSAFLGIPESLSFQPPPYLRILGMNPAGTIILKQIKDRCQIPYSTSLASLRDTSPLAKQFAQLEASATDTYSIFAPTILPCGRDYTEKAVHLFP